MTILEGGKGRWNATTSVDEPDKRTVFDRPEELLILHVDVSQGESTIVMLRVDRVVTWCAVIDGGFAVQGRGAITRYLEAFEVQKVDALICSHFDGDHTKGLTALIRHHYDEPFAFNELWVRNTNENDAKSSTKQLLLEAARRKGIPPREISKGIQVTRGQFSMTCIHADSEWRLDENDASLGFLIKYGNFRYYTAGDLPSSCELKLLDQHKQQIHAFKCGHHGSANSTPVELLKRWCPLVAVISCGEQSFGHPSYDVIERLLSKKSSVQGIYLTNCIHNRKALNIEYEAHEEEIARRLQDWLQNLKFPMEKFHDIKNGYDEEAIIKALGELEELMSKSNDEESLKRLRTARRLLKAALRSAAHSHVDLRDDATVFVAGNEEMLGTITLCIPLTSEEPHIWVGLYHGITYHWYHHGKSDAPPPPDYLREIQERAVGAIRIFTGEGERPTANIARSSKETYYEFGEPGVAASTTSPVRDNHDLTEYEERFDDRRNSYRRFSVPTIIGLHAGTKNEPFVPLCSICKIDSFAKDELTPMPLIELRCDECDDEDNYVHRSCYAKNFPLAKLSCEDETIADVERKTCPLCSDRKWVVQRKKAKQDDEKDEDVTGQLPSGARKARTPRRAATVALSQLMNRPRNGDPSGVRGDQSPYVPPKPAKRDGK